MIQKNLRDAVRQNAVTISEVFALIQEAEENGNQHIFYFRPTSKNISESLTFESVAQRLWGERTARTLKSFPSLALIPEKFTISDFRQPTSKKPNDWLLKVYGRASRNRAPVGRARGRSR